MSKKVKAYIGHGENRLSIELTSEQASEVKRLQKHFQLQREEKALAEKEHREPRPVKY